MKKILITGSSGFIGGFIVEKALEKGYQVFAVVRKSSNRQYLKDPRINFLELNLGDQARLETQLNELKDENGQFDYVIHNAGITKANRNSQYFEVNTELTNRLVDALIETKLVGRKFIFISSLAAAGPGMTDAPIKVEQEPNPVTSYGKSKLKAEQYLITKTELPYIILRPTAVFGPRDTELFTLFNLVNRGFEFYIGTNLQKLSFIYVRDLVEMLFGAMETDSINKTYFISDGQTYLVKDFVAAIKTSLGAKTLSLCIPVPIVSGVAFLLEKVLSLFGQVPALNQEKMAELTSKNWSCDMSPFFNEVGIQPQYNLQTAVDETVTWYKKENWI